MADSAGLAATFDRDAEEDAGAWTKRVLSEALRLGGVRLGLQEVAGELALGWHAAGDVRRGMHAIFWLAVFEQEHCDSLADLLCWLRAIIPELPREQGCAPIRFTQQLAEVCWQEIDMFLRVIFPVDTRASCVVTCALDPGVAIAEVASTDSKVRVRCSMMGARELGAFDVPRDSPYGSMLGMHIRKRLGSDVGMCVTLVSEDGQLLWREQATFILAAVKALLQHLSARCFLNGCILQLVNSADAQTGILEEERWFLDLAKNEYEFLMRLSMINCFRDDDWRTM